MSITANMYQEQCKNTAIYPYEGEWGGLAYVTLGLAGEAGEAANTVKKIARDDHCVVTEEKRYQILDELGDAAWYLAQTCTELGASLDDVLEHNLAKLRDRYQRGLIKGSGDDR